MDENYIKLNQQVSEVNKILREYFPGAHQYEVTSLSKFENLNTDYYHSTTNRLVKKGFKLLGDVENLTLKEKMSPTCIRAFKSEDGVIQAAIFHFRAKGFLGRFAQQQVLDFETELSDGHFVRTSNVAMPSVLKKPPQLDIKYAPNSDMSTLLANHKERVDIYLRSNPNVTVIKIETLPDLLKSQNRFEKMQSDFHRRKGAFTTEDIKKQTEPSTVELNRPRSIKALLILFGGGIFMTSFGGWHLYKTHLSKSWPSVTGEIVSTQMLSETRRSGDHGSKTVFRPEIKYVFNVNGHDYESDKRHFGDEYTRKSKAEEILSKYQSFAYVKVFYNSENPSESVLESNIKLTHVFIFIIGCVFFYFGIKELLR